MNETPTSPQNQRTIVEIRHDRGEEYPQSRGLILNSRKDREDLFRAAYDLILSHGEETLMKILRSRTSEDRLVRTNQVKPIDGRLSLYGMIKKIVSFDEKQKIKNSTKEPEVKNPTAPQLLDIYKDMQQIFEPESLPDRSHGGSPTVATAVADQVEKVIQKVTPPTNLHHFRQSDDSFHRPQLKTFDERFGEAARKPQITPHLPTPVKLAEVFEMGQMLPPKKKFSSPQPKPVEPVTVAPPVVIPERVPVIVAVPKFGDYPAAVSWLREQKQWQEEYSAMEGAKDELALFAYLFRTGIHQLRTLLIDIKTQFGIKDIKKIIGHILDLGSLDQEASTKKPEIISLKKENEIFIQKIFILHEKGEYAAFWSEYMKLFSNETLLEEIESVRKSMSYGDMLDTIAGMSDKKMSHKDKALYRRHSWSQRLGNMRGVGENFKALFASEKPNSKPAIIKHTQGLKIKVPDSLRGGWHGFEEIDAPEKTLYDVIVSLVKTRPGYEKDDEKSTKKLLRIIKIICKKEELTDKD